jgi:hypothetical protein
MAKKLRAKKRQAARSKSRVKTPVRKKAARPEKPRLRPIDLKVQQRIAELGVNPTRVAEASLQIKLDLEQKPLKPAEREWLYLEAKNAMEAAILTSDDPEEWIRAGKKAAQLQPREEPK